MITIAIANQKGGVGKTTTAVTLGHALAIRNYRTCIVDTDPQGHVAVSLGLEKAPGLYRLLVDEDPAESVMVNAREHLTIIPSDKRTEKAKRYLISQDYRERTLDYALSPLDAYIDVCLIDLAPSLDVLHVASLVASDWMVIPTRLDHLAVDGVNEILRTYAELYRLGGGHIEGFSILPTFFDRTTRETMIQLEALVTAYGDNVLPPIPLDTKSREASAHGQTLLEYAPRSAALTGYPTNTQRSVGGYIQVLDRLVERLSL